MAQPFDISLKTLIKITAFAAALWFLIEIRDIILLLFIALVLAAIVDPFADWLERKKIPRGLSVIIIYIILIATAGGVVSLVAPKFINEVRELSSSVSNTRERVFESLGKLKIVANNLGLEKLTEGGVFQAGLTQTAGKVISRVTGFFGGLVSIIIVVALTFYMVVHEDQLKKLFLTFTPTSARGKVSEVLHKIRAQLSKWIRAQLLLSIIVAVVVYVALLLLGVKYALVLALIAGFLEMIPYLGPVLAAIVAIFFTFADSPIKALFVTIFFVIFQQIENHIIVPKVMQQAVGLNPLVSIVSILIGAKLAGFAGVLLAIPVATAVMVIVHEIIAERERVRA
ncbi:MAG: hypothetical protein HW383_539 [Candidatus Magasanikbacteria bacterium]|nr:hypothetical protein [Candidatus Magasanikbacteria bacterium]